MKAPLTLLFVVAVHAAWSQTTFNVVREHPSILSYNGALSVNELADGYLMFSFGWSLDSAVAAVFATKFDLEGNFVWEKEHRRERDIYPGIVDPIASISGGRFVGAMSEYGDTLPETTYLYWWNSEGDTIRTRFLKSDSNVVSGNHGTRQLLALADGGFLHCGWCANTTPGQGGCITRLDSAGAILWERIYTQAQYILNAHEAPDGGFVLGGYRNGQQDRAVVIRTDSAGNVQWVRYHGLYAGTGAHRAQIDEQGNVLVPGNWKDDPSPLTYDTWACLFRYASNGALLPRRDYYFHRSTYTAHLVPKGGGHYWMVGATWQTGYDPDYATLVWELDENLDSLWMRRYWFYASDDAENLAYSARSTSDSGMVLCGVSRQGVSEPLPYKQDNWLLKLDSYGCLVPGCQSVGIQDHVLGLNEYLSISPNPVAQGQAVQVRWEPPQNYKPQGSLRVVVLDATGRTVLQVRMASSTLSLTMPASGLYYVHLADGQRWLAGGKVVVE
ncbi:MAG: T9SS type A sorting domain-containing protein [Flavobacteriales bacterium]|jgi:hypothetical protein|nr:T9SS type A sorting domain-containing protein [Flavobacteriales bacterium]